MSVLFGVAACVVVGGCLGFTLVIMIAAHGPERLVQW